MENLRIRAAAQRHGVKLWEVAEGIGITDSSFSRKLRRELPTDEQERIVDMIQMMAQQKGAKKNATKDAND